MEKTLLAQSFAHSESSRAPFFAQTFAHSESSLLIQKSLYLLYPFSLSVNHINLGYAGAQVRSRWPSSPILQVHHLAAAQKIPDRWPRGTFVLDSRDVRGEYIAARQNELSSAASCAGRDIGGPRGLALITPRSNQNTRYRILELNNQPADVEQARDTSRGEIAF